MNRGHMLTQPEAGLREATAGAGRTVQQEGHKP